MSKPLTNFYRLGVILFQNIVVGYVFMLLHFLISNIAGKPEMPLCGSTWPPKKWLNTLEFSQNNSVPIKLAFYTGFKL